MYTIVILASLFSTPTLSVKETSSTFITREACTLVADKLTKESGLVHQCRPLVTPRSI